VIALHAQRETPRMLDDFNRLINKPAIRDLEVGMCDALAGRSRPAEARSLLSWQRGPEGSRAGFAAISWLSCAGWKSPKYQDQ
jgi:hypothetical protein